MKVEEKVSLAELFFTFLRVNAFTFGGGYTIVAILRDEFVDKKKLFSNEDMLDMTALAQSAPGAMAINTSMLVGYRLRGFVGALVCLLASVLPSLVIITIISKFYQAFRDNYYVAAALRGMSGVISAVLIITTINMARSAMKKHPIFSLSIMVLAFVASFVFDISTIVIILVFGLVSLLVFSHISEEDLK